MYKCSKSLLPAKLIPVIGALLHSDLTLNRGKIHYQNQLTHAEKVIVNLDIYEILHRLEQKSTWVVYKISSKSYHHE